MSFLPTWGLRIGSIAITGVYRVYRSHPFVWRTMARNYRPWMGGFAALHARMTCALAAREVPAYREFLRRGTRRGSGLASYTPTGKDDYVKAFPEEERCWKGRLEITGSVVDESSGSSGTPYNWVRSRRELNTVHRNLAGYTSLVFPSRKLFVINAYSMGAWATGTNTGIAMAKVAMVKNTGPDLEKIVDTLRHFGPRFDYLITAYPPFCKHLADRLKQEDWFDPKKFRMAAMVGGEGMTEALRDYLGDTFGKVRSGYGASDLTIGMGGETTFSVWLRRMLRPDGGSPELRAALLGTEEQRLPMVFQYNPLETYLEVDTTQSTTLGRTGNVLCTINSTAVMAPKLRYDIADEGTLLSFPKIWAVLRKLAADGHPELLAAARRAHARERMQLPLLLLYGRADSTVSFMGANIYPQDVEYGLYRDNPQAQHLAGFCLALAETERLEARPVIHLRLRQGVELDAARRAELERACREGVLAHLLRSSRDFAQAVSEDASAAELKVEVHGFADGPFAGAADGPGGASIKNKYLSRSGAAAGGSEHA